MLLGILFSGLVSLCTAITLTRTITSTSYSTVFVSNPVTIADLHQSLNSSRYGNVTTTPDAAAGPLPYWHQTVTSTPETTAELSTFWQQTTPATSALSSSSSSSSSKICDLPIDPMAPNPLSGGPSIQTIIPVFAGPSNSTPSLFGSIVAATPCSETTIALTCRPPEQCQWTEPFTFTQAPQVGTEGGSYMRFTYETWDSSRGAVGMVQGKNTLAVAQSCSYNRFQGPAAQATCYYTRTGTGADVLAWEPTTLSGAQINLMPATITGNGLGLSCIEASTTIQAITSTVQQASGHGSTTTHATSPTTTGLTQAPGSAAVAVTTAPQRSTTTITSIVTPVGKGHDTSSTTASSSTTYPSVAEMTFNNSAPALGTTWSAIWVTLGMLACYLSSHLVEALM